MKNRFLIAAVLILAATSCAKDRRPQPPMGWTAQDAVDRICGVYRLDSVEWTGQPVDLNGDGYAASLMEELLGGQWLGIQADCEATVHPATKLNTPTDAPVRVYFGDFLDNGNGGYSLGELALYYSVNASGEISLTWNNSINTFFSGSADSHFRFANVDVRIENDLLAVSVDTDYWDLATGTIVSGREILRYKCISTKQKP